MALRNVLILGVFRWSALVVVAGSLGAMLVVSVAMAFLPNGSAAATSGDRPLALRSFAVLASVGAQVRHHFSRPASGRRAGPIGVWRSGILRRQPPRTACLECVSGRFRRSACRGRARSCNRRGGRFRSGFAHAEPGSTSFSCRGSRSPARSYARSGSVQRWCSWSGWQAHF
jgi:hypothetical protein